MTQIPILSGVYADTSPDYRTAYPVNMEPIPKVTGISQGYLRVASGVSEIGTGPGVTRGGIEWNGVLYRVMGDKLVSVAHDGGVTELGSVFGRGPVSMTYSFDRLAIASAGRLWYFDGSDLIEVTDSDLGTARDVVWIGGYFVTTDGENLVVTELNDPRQVNPLKYGSSEIDPDPVVAVKKIRNELYAVNRYSIETFSNVGGNNFPFQVINGTQVLRGAVGTHAVCVYREALAFVGSGRNEEPGVYIGGGGSSAKISTREIDTYLRSLSESALSEIVVEAVTGQNRLVLMVHTPNGTWCFDGAATEALGQPVWYQLTSDVFGDGPYLARHFVWHDGRWNVGNPTGQQLGYINDKDAETWGDPITWSFTMPVVYNEGRGAIVHQLDLAGLFGGVSTKGKPKISLEHSLDGVNWSMPIYTPLGAAGNRTAPAKFTRVGMLRGQQTMRVAGDSNAMIAVARVDAQIEPLAW